MCVDQLTSLETLLTEKDADTQRQIDQLTAQHDITLKHLHDKHQADVNRIRAGMYDKQRS